MRNLLVMGGALLALYGCGEQFDSKQPWNNPVVDGSLKQESMTLAALLSIVNPFVREDASENYYFEEISLSSESERLTLFQTPKEGKLFELSSVTKASSYNGKWQLRVNRFTKENFILLNFNDGKEGRVLVDEKNSDQFLYNGVPFLKTKIESSDLLKIPNKFCKMNVTSAGRELRKLIEALSQTEQKESIDFESCIATYKSYIDESRDPTMSDNTACKNLNKKYKELTKSCKL